MNKSWTKINTLWSKKNWLIAIILIWLTSAPEKNGKQSEASDRSIYVTRCSSDRTSHSSRTGQREHGPQRVEHHLRRGHLRICWFCIIWKVLKGEMHWMPEDSRRKNRTEALQGMQLLQNANSLSSILLAGCCCCCCRLYLIVWAGGQSSPLADDVVDKTSMH